MKRHMLWGLTALFLATEAFAAGGAVTGKVTLDGPVPGRKKLDMNADPACAAKHTQAALSDAFVVSANGAMKNVFVYVKKGLEGKKFAPPPAPVVLDQRGCVYVPHVAGVQAGQPVKILNSDGTLHNVHSVSKVNAAFNLAMPKMMKEKVVRFDKPEIMVPVKCDVHPWMQSFIGILDHPFYGVTADAGTFELKGLPPGKYTIEAWHEVCGFQTQEVTVTEGGTASANFTYKAPGK